MPPKSDFLFLSKPHFSNCCIFLHPLHFLWGKKPMGVSPKPSEGMVAAGSALRPGRRPPNGSGETRRLDGTGAGPAVTWLSPGNPQVFVSVIDSHLF